MGRSDPIRLCSAVFRSNTGVIRKEPSNQKLYLKVLLHELVSAAWRMGLRYC